MLLSFRVENHKSVRHEQQLLLTPTYEDAHPENADWEATTVAGIFGANASGKSNLLDALVYMRDTVRWSMSTGEPGGGIARSSFALDLDAEGEPSTFVVDLMLSGVRHTYGFAVDDERVVEEWLYTYPKRRKRVLFERDGAEFSFGEGVPAKLRQVRDITGPNVLFLTVAARASNADVEPIYRWFSEALLFAEERGTAAPSWLRGRRATEEQMTRLGELLSSAGTGVRSVELSEGAVPASVASRQDLIKKVLAKELESIGGEERAERRSRFLERFSVSAPAGEGRTEAAGSIAERLYGGHHGLFPTGWSFGDALFGSPELLFHHGEGDRSRPLVWREESKGTRTLTALGYEAQRALETGGVLIVDEIDASLHPYLSARVISLFRSETHNPHGAQLVFTSHDAALLGRIRGEEVLKRDHIWFVDKDGEGRSTLYPLSDFKPRGDDNRARRYLTGRYGAVPDVDDELFQRALVRRVAEGDDGVEGVTE
ncbi:AAA family ATPase [Nocardiopsis alba]|uniref:AAA family ATPase n=1 Tax=Nocardiopsis alba TaxID=53437 RepID=UPI0035E39A3C